MGVGLWWDLRNLQWTPTVFHHPDKQLTMDRRHGTILLCLRGCPADTGGLHSAGRCRWRWQRWPFPCNQNVVSSMNEWPEQVGTHLMKTWSASASSGNGIGCRSCARPGRQSSNSELQNTTIQFEWNLHISVNQSVSNEIIFSKIFSKAKTCWRRFSSHKAMKR